MMKFIGFLLLWQILGNPFVALLLIFFILYVLDRRFIGFFPSLTKPFKRMRKTSSLRQQIRLNPNDVSSKYELASLLLERKKYSEANQILTEILPRMDQDSHVLCDLGLTYIKLGDIGVGEKYILEGLNINPRTGYGQPYLELAKVFTQSDKDKTYHYLKEFRDIHSSSCESYYLLGKLYEQSGRKEEAKEAYKEVIEIYRSLPKYMKRHERKWAMLSRMKSK
ncbi:tetratricopeptide repeat protein [Chengkuizengella axinellae]|uniref:Tetratricopeptide repeat protein n=1 Tax=Chengkuizengella axinellae TaxID=3064388 RepID=A0ABT9J439_9BACL|nr:tetratricopeptide repeat protein [Chengkuizengella sp. 2205SS18-9]MDP5276387.1 tetratricopeptide repeat protein [Chengkuizengella sp. 2205SS18-9]